MSLRNMNEIHPTCIIDSNVVLGKNNKILPYTILIGPLEIGDDNIIGPHVVIGSPGADTRNPRYDSSQCRVKIGSHNIIREYSAIQKPCYEGVTEIGNYTYLMQAANLSHDVIIEDEAVVTANCALAGMAKILRGANLGMGCTINQRTVIGQYSIVATGAPAMKHVIPFSRYIPNKPISVNEYAIKKFGFTDVADEIRDYVLRGVAPKAEKLVQVIAHYEAMVAHNSTL